MHIVEKTIIVPVGDGAVPIFVGADLVQRQRLFLFIFGSYFITLKLIPFIGEGDGQPLIKERHLLEPRPQGLKIELYSLENLGIRVERLNSAGNIRRITPTKRTVGDTTVGKGNMPGITLAVHLGYHAG